jgi:hypothetical protein
MGRIAVSGFHVLQIFGPYGTIRNHDKDSPFEFDSIELTPLMRTWNPELRTLNFRSSLSCPDEHIHIIRRSIHIEQTDHSIRR